MAKPKPKRRSTTTTRPREPRGNRRALELTEGQRLFAALTDPPSEIAAKLHVAKSMVSHWRSGLRRPSPAWRAIIERAYEIPADAWGLAPKSASTRESDDADAMLPTTSTLAAVDEQLARLKRQVDHSDDLPPMDRHQLEQRYHSLLRLRQRIEEAHELLEDRVVREHPAWRRARAAMLGALKKHPAALRDVVEALERVGQ